MKTSNLNLPNLCCTKEGYLTKEGRNFKTLKQRWFVLSGKHLSYYENKDKIKKKGELEICHDTKVSFIETLKNSREGMMYLITPKRTLFLFGDINTIKEWKVSFESNIYLCKYFRKVNDLINEELFKGENEILYLDLLIRLCIKYRCDEQIIRKFLTCLGIIDDRSLIPRSLIFSILLRFQPIIQEDDVIVFKPHGFSLSSVTELLSNEWFSGFEKVQEVIDRLKYQADGTFCVTFSEAYPTLYLLFIKCSNGVQIKKIIHHERGFEIDDYISFDTICDLIHWYHKHSLPDIGIELKYPSRKQNYLFNIDNENKMYQSIDEIEKINSKSLNLSIQDTRIDFHKAILKEKLGRNIYRCNINGFTCTAKIFDSKNGDDLNIILDNIELLKSISDDTHIVKYLHHKVIESKVILFLEYLPTTLYSVVRSRALQGKRFSPRTVLSIALELIRSINKLHCQNPHIVHKNIYINHIFVQLNPFESPLELKLSDFGNYMSLLADNNKILPPELLNSMPKDVFNNNACSSDIYNFGIVLYEVLTLKKPFAKEKNIRECISKGKIPNIPTLDERYKPIIDIIKLCLSDNPNLRPTSETILKEVMKLLT